jgi:tetratricopeptide (TPR) repeat protein
MQAKLEPKLDDPVFQAEACFGAGLPAEAEQALLLAGENYQHDAIAEAHLHRALTVAPWHIAVYIGLYRFYFYKGRLNDAIGVAVQCLEQAATRIQVDSDWRCVQPSDAEFDDYAAILPRFYLFTLKAYGYLQMRLGNLEIGRAVTTKLLELDPQNKMGGKVLLQVLDRMGKDDDDD